MFNANKGERNLPQRCMPFQQVAIFWKGYPVSMLPIKDVRLRAFDKEMFDNMTLRYEIDIDQWNKDPTVRLYDMHEFLYKKNQPLVSNEKGPIYSSIVAKNEFGEKK